MNVNNNFPSATIVFLFLIAVKVRKIAPCMFQIYRFIADDMFVLTSGSFMLLALRRQIPMPQAISSVSFQMGFAPILRKLLGFFP